MPKEKVNKKIRENENKKPKDKKEELAKAYKVDLENIEHISVDDGKKEFFKIYNPKDRSIKLIEIYAKGNDAQNSFEQSQKDLSFAQGDDAKSNAKEIFEYDLKYKHKEVNLIPIIEFKGRAFKSLALLRELNTITRKKVMAILKGCKKGNIKLRYINLENAIGIDENGSVIEVTYDYISNKASIKGAKVVNTKNQTFDIDKDIDEVNISSDELTGIFECITVTSDGPTLISDKKISIRETEISTKSIIDFYNMPELMDKVSLSTNEKNIYKFIIDSIVNKINSSKVESEQNQSRKARQFVKSQGRFRDNEEDSKAA